MIDNAGYLKLVDFGSAKHLPGGSRTNTVSGLSCGRPCAALLASFLLCSLPRPSLSSPSPQLCGAAEYIAPEMVLSKGYNRAIDFWAIGVLFFELLTATTPFAHANLVVNTASCFIFARLLSHLITVNALHHCSVDGVPEHNGLGGRGEADLQRGSDQIG